MKEFRERNNVLDNCSQLALKQPILDKWLILMTDARFQVAGYAVLTEDDPNQKFTSAREAWATVAYGSKTFTPSQIKTCMYAEDCFGHKRGIQRTSTHFGDHRNQLSSWQSAKRWQIFCRTKLIPPPLWNACNFVLQFNFTKTHILDKMNTAADFFVTFGVPLIRKKYSWNKKTFLHNRAKSKLNQQEQHKEVKLFFRQMTSNCRPKKNYVRADKKRKAVLTVLSVITVSHRDMNDKCTNTIMQNIESFNKVPRIVIEQDADSVLFFKRQMFGLTLMNET